MRVVISGVLAVNPSVVRVQAYTYAENEAITDYEIAIPIELFTTRNEETQTVEVDLAEFQQVVSQRIIDMQNVANLARYINSQDIEWDLVVERKEQKEDTPDDLKLAYGEEK